MLRFRLPSLPPIGIIMRHTIFVAILKFWVSMYPLYFYNRKAITYDNISQQKLLKRWVK